MQNKKFWLLAASLLLVVGCANNKPKDNKLRVAVNDEETGLTWAEVNGATGYRVTVDDEDPEALEDPFYEFDTIEGEYHVLIEALKGEKVLKKATFDYETIETYISDIEVEDKPKRVRKKRKKVESHKKVNTCDNVYILVDLSTGDYFKTNFLTDLSIYFDIPNGLSNVFKRDNNTFKPIVGERAGHRFLAIKVKPNERIKRLKNENKG